jgi:hypothetical protein
MTARELFGVVIRSIGTVCILLGLGRLVFILELPFYSAGQFRADYIDPVAMTTFYIGVGIALLFESNWIVRFFYGRPN